MLYGTSSDREHASEEIAFYNGHEAENKQLVGAFQRLCDQMSLIYKKRIPYIMIGTFSRVNLEGKRATCRAVPDEVCVVGSGHDDDRTAHSHVGVHQWTQWR